MKYCRALNTSAVTVRNIAASSLRIPPSHRKYQQSKRCFWNPNKPRSTVFYGIFLYNIILLYITIYIYFWSQNHLAPLSIRRRWGCRTLPGPTWRMSPSRTSRTSSAYLGKWLSCYRPAMTRCLGDSVLAAGNRKFQVVSMARETISILEMLR